MKNSKGKHQHNFTEQTTQAILNQYRRKGKIHHANEPLRHTQKASQVLTEQKIFRYKQYQNKFTAQANLTGNIR